MIVLHLQDRLNLEHAVFDAVRNAFNDHHLPEPQLVANLAWHLPQRLRNSQFAQLHLGVGSVFIHGQPLVHSPRFPKPSTKSVELGDLLLVRTLVQHGTPVERRALMLQAKKSQKPTVKPDNENQWFLYERWPLFTYQRGKTLSGQCRHVRERDMNRASQYLIITPPPSLSQWRCTSFTVTPFHNFTYCIPTLGHQTAHPTSPALSNYHDFTKTLVDFILGNAGKRFIYQPTNDIGWNQVVTDLLDVTSNSVSKFIGRAASGGTLSRGIALTPIKSRYFSHHAIATHHEDSAYVANLDGPPMDINPWPSDGDPEYEGISIIEFVVGEMGEEQRYNLR